MSALYRKMSDAHEAFLATLFGGRQTRGSGNQWRDPADGRMDRREVAVAFAWDGKSTRARSMTIKRDDLDKIVEQAHVDRPMLGVRFYDDDRLRGFEDWVLVRADDMAEVVGVDHHAKAKAVEAILDRHWEFTDYEEDMPGTALVNAIRSVLR